MLSYSCQQLRSIGTTCTAAPQRNVRKLLYKYHLWNTRAQRTKLMSALSGSNVVPSNCTYTDCLVANIGDDCSSDTVSVVAAADNTGGQRSTDGGFNSASSDTSNIRFGFLNTRSVSNKSNAIREIVEDKRL